MSFSFKAYFGNEIRTVNLSNPHGAGKIYHIMIDKFYYGQVCLMMDGWHVYLNSDKFTAADADILLDLMAANNLFDEFDEDN